MKIRLSVSTGYVGSKIEEIHEVDNDMTEAELNEYFKEWVWNAIYADWSIEDESD